MHYILSYYAETEMNRRGIPESAVASIMDAPHQKVKGHGEITCYQSRINFYGKMYLLRLMVDETDFPPRVVTVYRTSRIAKYWEAEG
jgi:hypothetical protein